MKSLDEFNKERLEKHQPFLKDEVKNNIACPECGEELYDIQGAMLMSNPPQLRVKCKNCGFTGTRYE